MTQDVYMGRQVVHPAAASLLEELSAQVSDGDRMVADHQPVRISAGSERVV